MLRAATLYSRPALRTSVKPVLPTTDSYILRANVRVDQARLKEKGNDKAGAEAPYKAAIADYGKAGELDKAVSRSVARPPGEARKRLLALRP